MGNFTTILWDVDGTLLDFKYSQREALGRSFHTIGRKMTEDILERYDRINDSFWKRLERGEITKSQLLPGRFLQLFEELQIKNVDVEAFRQEYQEELGRAYAYLDDSLSICRSLYGNVKQYVVTNGVTSVQVKKLKGSGLCNYMEAIFSSEQIGAPKPQKEFFAYCLAQVEEKDLDRILLVGDSLSSDIKGGVDAGIPTCWYRPSGTVNHTDYRPDYEIDDLHQIFEILG